MLKRERLEKENWKDRSPCCYQSLGDTQDSCNQESQATCPRRRAAARPDTQCSHSWYNARVHVCLYVRKREYEGSDGSVQMLIL